MAIPGQHEAYWIATTPETDYFPLNNPLTVDVAILGGGIAGVTAASLLKAAGATVALVDAKRIVTGVTGHTTAKVTSAHGLKYQRLIETIGEEKAHVYAEANQHALQLIVETATRRGIDCDLRRMRACTYGDNESERERVEQEVQAAQSLGLPATFEEEISTLPFRTWGAVCFADQAIFHPRKYLLALAEEIPGEGSHILEQTRALDVEEGTVCEVQTDRGTIRASHVIVATHYPFLDRGLYFTRLKPQRSYALAFRMEGAVPDGMFIGAQPGYRSIRPHPTEDGWIVIAGSGLHWTGHGHDTWSYYEDLERWVREQFPVQSIDYYWSTQDNQTPDGLPFIGKYTAVSQNLHVATGFDGWGMTQGTAAAMILSDSIVGRDNPWANTFQPTRLDVSQEAPHLFEIGKMAIEHEVGSRLKAPEAKSLAEVGKGEGKITEVDGERMAVYRDEEDQVHAVSPACTHLGCIVSWNSAEKTWDCPCHGSRYRPDGTFIHGPTVKDLKRLNPEG